MRGRFYVQEQVLGDMLMANCQWGDEFMPLSWLVMLNYKASIMHKPSKSIKKKGLWPWHLWEGGEIGQNIYYFRHLCDCWVWNAGEIQTEGQRRYPHWRRSHLQRPPGQLQGNLGDVACVRNLTYIPVFFFVYFKLLVQ